MLPMVSMTVFGKTLRTQKIKNEVFDYDFEEHFYFSGIDKVIFNIFLKYMINLSFTTLLFI
jgi:hypothetical protein